MEIVVKDENGDSKVSGVYFNKSEGDNMFHAPIDVQNAIPDKIKENNPSTGFFYYTATKETRAYNIYEGTREEANIITLDISKLSKEFALNEEKLKELNLSIRYINNSGEKPFIVYSYKDENRMPQYKVKLFNGLEDEEDEEDNVHSGDDDGLESDIES